MDKAIEYQSQFLASLPAQNPTPVLRADYKGKIIYANEASKELLDYWGIEINGVITNDLREILIQSFQNTETVEIEYSTDKHTYILTFVPIVDHSYVNIYGSDITKLKVIQEELEQISLIAREINNGVIITDTSGQVQWVNKGFETMTGYTLEELKGKIPGQVLQGAETDPETINRIAEAIHNKIPIQADILNYRKDGSSYWVKLFIQPVFDKEGNLTQFISIQNDTTLTKVLEESLKESDSRMSSLISNLHEGVLVEDQEGIILLANKEFCRLLNVPLNPEDLKGMKCSTAAKISKDSFKDGELFLSRIEQIYTDINKVIGEEIEMADGRILRRDFIPITLSDNFLGILWKYQDVTKQKTFESALKKAKAEAEIANAHKSLFLARMSHEIRTPMNAIIGMVRLMEDTEMSEEQKKIIQNLNFSSRNLLGIVNEILDYSKIESGKILIENIPFNLKSLIYGLFDAYNTLPINNQLSLKVQFDERLNGYYIGDQNKIQQVISNLLNNAFKFTHFGSIEIVCEALEEYNDHVKFRCSVIDTGIGIEKEKLAFVFNDFWQEDESVSRNFGGTGLGLAISKQLIRLMGGEVQVLSEKGHGSTFSFILDLKKSDTVDLPTQKSGKLINNNVIVGSRILLVEDNEFNQFFAKSVLERLLAEVDIADNGEIALELLRNKSYDLVLMDLEMPVLDGYSAIDQIRNILKLNTPIIALTANVMQGFIKKALDAGASDYLIKPFEPEELIYKITALIGQKAEPVLKLKKLQDISSLIQILGNDPEQVKIMLRKFMEVTPAYFNAMIEAFDKKDYSHLSHASHKLKSSIDLVANDELKSVIGSINAYSRDKENLGELDGLIEYFSTAFPLLIEELNLEINK